MHINTKLIKKITGRKVVAYKRCVSTFDDIEDNDVIIALSQRNGYGRGSHTFHSPRGGLYIVIRENGLSINPHTLTPAVGIAVHDTIKSVLGIDTRLKWVNDVIYHGKKVCGILCRSPRRGEYLIGIGINFSTDINELLKVGLNGATTLSAPPEKATKFCIELIKNVHSAAISTFDKTRYESLCNTIGKTVSFVYKERTIEGYAEQLEQDGSLIIRIGKATVVIDAGEVSIVEVKKKHEQTQTE